MLTNTCSLHSSDCSQHGEDLAGWVGVLANEANTQLSVWLLPASQPLSLLSLSFHEAFHTRLFLTCPPDVPRVTCSSSHIPTFPYFGLKVVLRLWDLDFPVTVSLQPLSHFSKPDHGHFLALRQTSSEFFSCLTAHPASPSCPAVTWAPHLPTCPSFPSMNTSPLLPSQLSDCCSFLVAVFVLLLNFILVKLYCFIFEYFSLNYNFIVKSVNHSGIVLSSFPTFWCTIMEL